MLLKPNLLKLYYYYIFEVQTMMDNLAFMALSLGMLSCATLVCKEQRYIIDPVKTYFAVVTGKEGLASVAAHEHVVVAKNYEAKLSINEQDPVKSTFNLVVPTKKLRIDDPGDQKALLEILKRLKLRDSQFKVPDTKDLKEIRMSMLSKEQLDAGKFKNISLKIIKITKNKGKNNNYKIKFEMKVKKKSVAKSMDVTASSDKGLIKVIGYTKIKFSEFNIVPYTAFLGLVKVSDEFLLVLNLTAKKGP
jgi:polyisoprenoid-binding protein YceI